MTMSDLAIQVDKLHKTYHLGKTSLHVLRGVSLSVERGKFVAIVGASGSGKSTLLHLVGMLDRPDHGSIHLDDVDVETLSSIKRNAVRCRDVGFVFQFYHLLGELNVLENVLLPGMVDISIASWPGGRVPARKRAIELLESLGLGERLKHKPKELSGGERQRVAIARALMNRPKVLLADEPTGNLDSRTGKQIMDVLLKTNREQGQTILMVTHDQALATQAHQILHLQDGKIVT
jgi:ABC-type lipoprotein export system ATPase subunit